MKKALPLIIFLLATLSTSVSAQSLVFRTYISVTDTVEDDGVIFPASSDDAEQENNEMDALFDDDLDTGWEGAPEDQNTLTTGLRFRNVFIPKGAKIDSAFILICSHEGKSAEDVAKITLFGQASDNPETFNETDLITDRPRTSASILWQVAEKWELWGNYRTPNLKSILQEIVDRSGWEAGNAVALFLIGENQGVSDFENAREFESFENIADPEDGGDGQNHPERRPELLVYYSVQNAFFEVPITVTDTITDDGVTFEASSDDAEQENGEMDSLFDDDLDAGWEGAPEDQNKLTTGLRFRNIMVPKGAVIDSAFIRVWSHEGKSTEDVAKITITADATDHAQTFVETALITDRPRTNNSVLWEVAEEWELWGEYRTPNLRTIVQEIVNRDGWTAGNAIAFILEGENQGVSDTENAREFESYENIADPEDGGDGQNHPERRPRLAIYFSSFTTSVKDLFTTVTAPLTVFPNPAKAGSVFIELQTEESALIQLYDMQGKTVQSMLSSGGQKVEFNTGKLPTGTYLLNALQGTRIYSQKLVITE